MSPDTVETLVRLVVAAFLGGMLGLERERKHKPAGLRTHMMVALGSACFTLAALGVAGEVLDERPQATIDVTRIVQGIVGGIGFLCAGVIIRDGGSVRGLTTAGSLWLVGALGVAAGVGRFLLAIEAALLALVVLHVLGRIEHRWRKGTHPHGDDEEGEHASSSE